MTKIPSGADLHPTMERVYAAAIEAKLISGANKLTELASCINESPQMVKNWDKRGVSAQGLLKIQAATGINATWIETGEGEKFVRPPHGVQAPPPLHPRFEDPRKVSESEWAMLDRLRAFPEEDRAKAMAEITEKGDRWKAIREELLSKMGRP